MSTNADKSLKDEFRQDPPPVHCLDGGRPMSKAEREELAASQADAAPVAIGPKCPEYKPGCAF